MIYNGAPRNFIIATESIYSGIMDILSPDTRRGVHIQGIGECVLEFGKTYSIKQDGGCVDVIITEENYKRYLDYDIFKSDNSGDVTYHSIFRKRTYVERITWDMRGLAFTIISSLVKTLISKQLVYPLDQKETDLNSISELIVSSGAFGDDPNGVPTYVVDNISKYLKSMSKELDDSIKNLLLSEWGIYEVKCNSKTSTIISLVDDYRIGWFMHEYCKGKIEL